MAPIIRTVHKLSKYNSAPNSIQRQLCLNALDKKDDLIVVACPLTSQHRIATQKSMSIWEQQFDKAKWNCIMCLNRAVLVKTRTLLGIDNKSTKDLRDRFIKLLTASSSRASSKAQNIVSMITFYKRKTTGSSLASISRELQTKVPYMTEISVTNRKNLSL